MSVMAHRAKACLSGQPAINTDSVPAEVGLWLPGCAVVFREEKTAWRGLLRFAIPCWRDITMVTRKRREHTREFGNFQTPKVLARGICSLLHRRGLRPRSVLEPTCGTGSFLVAALERFRTIQKAVGVEIDGEMANRAGFALEEGGYAARAEVRHEDFYRADWAKIVRDLPDPLLIIGNPPWVTNSELGALGRKNLPEKSNFQNHRGIDAITGKGNFDISEWMLNRSLEWMDTRHAMLAMLCKTSVARKVLRRAWKTGDERYRAEVFLIDTLKHFQVRVDGCLLVIESSPTESDLQCTVYESLRRKISRTVWGFRRGDLVSDMTKLRRWEHLEGSESNRWRSGIKHDCSRVMEFQDIGGQYRNGLGEIVDLEPDYLYPMLKSADVANSFNGEPRRRMLVTQRAVGQDTGEIRLKAPRTWEYLERHGRLLDRRASSVFRKRPRFSVFGVGEYSFAPWKVAISGLYKKLAFRVVGPFRGKPMVFDDTCYFLGCSSRQEAEEVARLLNSGPAKEFLSAFIFWDAKRPITASVLRRLDLDALARELGHAENRGNPAPSSQGAEEERLHGQ